MLNVFDSLKSNVVNKTSFDEALNMGVPHLKDELWKYTRAKKFLSEQYAVYGETLVSEAAKALASKHSDVNLAVFLNGKYSSELSKFKDEELTVKFEACKKERSYFHFFSAVNHSFSNEGVSLHVGRNKKLTHPIRLLYLSDKNAVDVFSPVANTVVLESGAEAVVIEDIQSLSENSNFLSLRNSFEVKDNAVLKHYVIQNDSLESKFMSDLSVDVEANAKYETYTLCLGAGISRFDSDVNMKGSGSESVFDAFYGVRGTQHTDHHTKVNHLVPHTSSKQLYKGVLDDKGRAVFNGKVIIVQDAQKTDAEQLNKNLMLSDKAEIDTKPEMMIDADDVKCAHGAAIGQMSEEEIFYLKSRAISDKDARALLSRGYALETVSRISDEKVKEEISSLISEYIRD